MNSSNPRTRNCVKPGKKVKAPAPAPITRIDKRARTAANKAKRIARDATIKQHFAMQRLTHLVATPAEVIEDHVAEMKRLKQLKLAKAEKRIAIIRAKKNLAYNLFTLESRARLVEG